MNARHIIAAAALACFGLGAVSLGTSGLHTAEPHLGTAALAAPLNIKPTKKASRKAAGKTAKPARKTQARKTHKPRRNAQAAETPAPPPAPETAATQPQEQIPIVAVKTTREMGGGIAVVNASDMSDLDRAAAPDISLAAYSIMSYLGGPAAIPPDDDAAPTFTPAPADSAEVSADARNSYASTAPPAAPAGHIALEYVLMTFACALAAAAAVRVFVV